MVARATSEERFWIVLRVMLSLRMSCRCKWDLQAEDLRYEWQTAVVETEENKRNDETKVNLQHLFEFRMENGADTPSRVSACHE
jgi:hypothetical protein